MGEIKSTLDLVMERTRHLSMSAGERETQKRASFQKRLRGLLGRYEDGALPADGLVQRIAQTEAEENISDRSLVLQEIFDRIDPGHDNRRWLDLLAHLAPEIRAPLENALAAHREQQAALLKRSRQALIERLRNEHAIEGSAVVCNPEADPAYRKRLTALQRETKISIDGIIPTAND